MDRLTPPKSLIVEGNLVEMETLETRLYSLSDSNRIYKETKSSKI